MDYMDLDVRCSQKGRETDTLRMDGHTAPYHNTSCPVQRRAYKTFNTPE